MEKPYAYGFTNGDRVGNLVIPYYSIDYLYSIFHFKPDIHAL
jgi:hypothetical protein